MSTKKALRTLPAAASGINANHNDWLESLAFKNCEHALADWIYLGIGTDDWKIASIVCPTCGHRWDGFSRYNDGEHILYTPCFGMMFDGNYPTGVDND